jgi:sugar lactone lactonase YvrE
MADRAIRTVLDGMSYLEGPRWHAGRLYVSDFYTGDVVAVDLDGGADPETVANVPAQPSGLGWMPDGSMLVVSMRDRRVLRVRDGGAPEVHADLSELAPWHLNDMVVDSRGRAYVGNFGFDLMSGAPIRTAGIIRVDADGSAKVAAEDLRFPNGTVILPDARTLVVSETLGGRLTAFDLGDDGTLSNRRVWAKLSETADTEDLGELIAAGGVAPDGMALDAEGAIWVADALGGPVLRVREGGEILEEISPGTGVFSCALGGADGRTLVMCAAPSFAEHERRDTREALLLACEVDVPRAGLP